MWFDARAKLAEIAGNPPATPATSATNRAEAAPGVAKVASVATLLPQKPRVAPAAEPNRTGRAAPADAFTHGTSPGGRPVTWTGRVVSLDEWRGLTDWQRHGPRGAIWNATTGRWKQPEGGTP